MKYLRFVLATVLVAGLVAVAPLPAQAADDVVVSGGGWGHGIGMPQWGAKAMADSGANHEGILRYFYTDAQFGNFTLAEPLHIGVAQNLAYVQFIPNGQAEVCLNGECHAASAGETWALRSHNVEWCQLERDGVGISTPGQCSGSITWSNQPDTRIDFPSLNPGVNRVYARGRVIFKQIPGQPTFHVVVEVPLESYLLGLGEVPNSWHPEALKAQVVAARSYALFKAWRGLRQDCGCQLYGSTVDQVYRGWSTHLSGDMTEGGPNGWKWVNAVQETAGKAMWHSKHGPSRTLEAYYFSSTGGATENNEDVWGGSKYEYLRSVPDPGPTSWSQGFSFQAFANSLGFDTVSWVEITQRNASGSPRTILVQGTKSGSSLTKTYTGNEFRLALGLRSHYVKSVTGFVPPRADQVVLHEPTTGKWLYRNANGSISSIYYGNPGDYAFFGDWNCDGVDTPGLYRRSDGYVYLRNSNTQGVADISFFFGNPGDVPLAGDFNGNGCDTVSIYRPSEARFYIINKLGSADAGLGAADYSYLYGVHGDTPFVGDWTGNGIDTPGLRRNSDGFVYLRNTNTQGVADTSYFYGNTGDIVFAGDWDGDGDDTIGLYRPSNGTVYLRNTNTTGIADIAYQMGGRVHRAVAGHR
jgi:SpoIID/LytB domain protein